MSHILRSVYSGAFENMDTFCDTFIDKSREVTQMALDSNVQANNEKQTKVKKFVELINTLSEELVARAKQLGKYYFQKTNSH